MPRTAVTQTKIPTPYATALQAITFAAADTGNLNSTPLTGKQLLLAYNSSTTTPATVTVSSVSDTEGRTGDISAFSVAASASLTALTAAVSQQFPVTGWQQSDGNLYFQASSATIYFAVIQLL